MAIRISVQRMIIVIRSQPVQSSVSHQVFGEPLTDATFISFVVSKGPDAKTLNDISGYTKSDAQSYLSGIGADYIGHETYEFSDTVEKDKVIRTDPGVGASITSGTIVNVILLKRTRPSESIIKF